MDLCRPVKRYGNSAPTATRSARRERRGRRGRGGGLALLYFDRPNPEERDLFLRQKREREEERQLRLVPSVITQYLISTFCASERDKSGDVRCSGGADVTRVENGTNRILSD